MLTHRFGRKIKLPATVVIKHQIGLLMAQDEAKKLGAQLIELVPAQKVLETWDARQDQVVENLLRDHPELTREKAEAQLKEAGFL
jgi:hypothetical protein